MKLSQVITYLGMTEYHRHLYQIPYKSIAKYLKDPHMSDLSHMTRIWTYMSEYDRP